MVAQAPFRSDSQAQTFYFSGTLGIQAAASTRLNEGKIHPNRFVTAFFACNGWLFGYTIYSDDHARKRF